MEEFRNITIQLLADDTTPVDDSLASKSQFIACAYTLDSSVVVGNADNSMDTTKLGRLWANVQSEAGEFTFDLACELPFFLPTIDAKQEFVVTVGSAELVVSLRMIRAYFGKGAPDESGTRYWLVHRMAAGHDQLNKGQAGIHPVPIKTFISQRFAGVGSSAEEVVRMNFCSWRDEMLSNITRMIDAMRAALPEMGRRMLPHEAATSFPFFWVAVRGAGCSQFVGDIGNSAFRTGMDMPDEPKRRFVEYLASDEGPPAEIHSLSLARTYCHHGHLGLALVQVSVACELILGRTFREHLLARGAKPKAIKDNSKEVTLSQLLNLHLFSMIDKALWQEADDVVSKLNKARRLRNEVVHEGSLTSNISKSEVEEVISAAEELIRFIASSKTTAAP